MALGRASKRGDLKLFALAPVRRGEGEGLKNPLEYPRFHEHLRDLDLNVDLDLDVNVDLDANVDADVVAVVLLDAASALARGIASTLGHRFQCVEHGCALPSA